MRNRGSLWSQSVLVCQNELMKIEIIFKEMGIIALSVPNVK